MFFYSFVFVVSVTELHVSHKPPFVRFPRRQFPSPLHIALYSLHAHGKCFGDCRLIIGDAFTKSYRHDPNWDSRECLNKQNDTI